MLNTNWTQHVDTLGALGFPNMRTFIQKITKDNNTIWKVMCTKMNWDFLFTNTLSFPCAHNESREFYNIGSRKNKT